MGFSCGGPAIAIVVLAVYKREANRSLFKQLVTKSAQGAVIEIVVSSFKSGSSKNAC